MCGRLCLLLAVVYMGIAIITTGGGRATAASSGSVTVTGQGTNTVDIPIVVSATPGFGDRGDIDLEVVLSGQYFLGTSVVSFGADIVIVSFTVDNDSQITAYIDIDPAAAGGSRDISVTNLAGVGTGLGLFWISGLPGPPTNFVVTVDPSGIGTLDLTWDVGAWSTSTVIVVKEGSPPTGPTDGTLVYNGSGVSSTSNPGLNYTTSNYYYGAWSSNGFGYSTHWAQFRIGGGVYMLLIALIGLAVALGFFAYKVSFIVVSIASGMIWLALAAISAISPATIGIDSLSSNLYYMIAMVFLMMAFTPLLFQMRTDIKHESLVRGHPDREGYPGAGTESWTSWGPKPKKGKETSEDRQRAYKEELRRRTRK